MSSINTASVSSCHLKALFIMTIKRSQSNIKLSMTISVLYITCEQFCKNPEHYFLSSVDFYRISLFKAYLKLLKSKYYKIICVKDVKTSNDYD